jgi:hypothetical protein
MIFERPDRVEGPLWVVTSIFNPVRYRSRWRLYMDFRKMVRDAGAKLCTVEIAFGDRAFALDDGQHDLYVPLRSRDELWLKENGLQIGFERVPQDARHVGYIDADVRFARDDWADEILQQLQHHRVVQPFSELVTLGPGYEVLRKFKSYAWCMANSTSVPARGRHAYEQRNSYGSRGYWHPGISLFFRRSVLDALGGLVDWAVLGGGDLHMVSALAGQPFQVKAQLGKSGQRWLKIWRERARRVVLRDVGYCEGVVMHYHHGPRVLRAYRTRGQILVDSGFEPERDLVRASNGLWQLRPENVLLRDGIRKYFRARSEDSLEV